MQTLCDGWLAQTPRFRLLCWGGWILVLIAAALLCLYPVEQQRKAQQAALVRQRVAIQDQWRNLYLLASSVGKPFSPTEARPVPFSPLVYQSSLTRLIHWQPSVRGGELALKTAWDAVPQMFTQLAEQGMSTSQFSLSTEDADVLLTIQLERLNDD
ncbi:HofO family protein [Citrobacter sp. RHBSTW-00671]|uniref:HofO family protein n=1 Tax=Citrobacter sp. RHBSTW-00671 TaxID=2742660 RepID=UPI0017E6087F|nr:hypothetical protein [Citrobacter sp. RHBSTW-00671]MBA7965511.1 hypothetical protein [Citrobacter sp. RHBSTW-00671]HCJ6373772.1 hypothetical protein [Citrobacter freundii]